MFHLHQPSSTTHPFLLVPGSLRSPLTPTHYPVHSLPPVPVGPSDQYVHPGIPGDYGLQHAYARTVHSLRSFNPLSSLTVPYPGSVLAFGHSLPRYRSVITFPPAIPSPLITPVPPLVSLSLPHYRSVTMFAHWAHSDSWPVLSGEPEVSWGNW